MSRTSKDSSSTIFLFENEDSEQNKLNLHGGLIYKSNSLLINALQALSHSQCNLHERRIQTIVTFRSLLQKKMSDLCFFSNARINLCIE